MTWSSLARKPGYRTRSKASEMSSESMFVSPWLSSVADQGRKAKAVGHWLNDEVGTQSDGRPAALRVPGTNGVSQWWQFKIPSKYQMWRKSDDNRSDQKGQRVQKQKITCSEEVKKVKFETQRRQSKRAAKSDYGWYSVRLGWFAKVQSLGDPPSANLR